MIDNSFSVFSSSDGIVSFLKSTIESCNDVIGHYEFVINDISSNISNPELERTKVPTVKFLKAMKNEWEAFRNNTEAELKRVESGES